MISLATEVDDVLRLRGWAAAVTFDRGALRRSTAFAVSFGAVYGAAMGSYAGIAGSRPWNELLLQMTYSAIKVPLLLASTCLVAMPVFFVLNTLCGLRDDFRLALRAIAATQAGLAILLSSLAPFTLFWYFSFDEYGLAILFNACLFTVAGVSAQRLLRGHYQALIERSPRHRMMLRVWLVLYGFVGIQAAWMLRPFVGSRSDPVEFYRREMLDNAYVIVVRLLWNAFR